ncbi:RHS repeat-associated core domain-containing protein [Streptomyces sp. NPDC048282]|uniref:RHS repeat-associated core domain-containing protein n=1 Tax=Streptomyces sp. NPDC048282 TaxID=3365528 RepID=UPI0037179CF2
MTRRYTKPFGEARGSTLASWPDDKGFLGKPADAETGLTHIGAREYDPTIGRFLSADPVFAPDDHESLNGYAYANNTPVTKSDPTGLRPITACEQGCSDGHGGTYRDHLSPNGNGGWTYHSTATYVTRVNIKGVGNGTIFTTVTTVGGYRGVKVVFKKGPDPKQEDKGQCNGCWAMGTNPHYDRNANDIPDSGKLATWQKVILGVAFAVAAAVAVAPVAVEGALACLAAVIVCAEGAAEVISGGAGVSATSVWAAGGAKGAGYRNLMEADDVFGLNAAKALPKEGFYDVAIHGSKTDFGKSIDSWSKGTRERIGS